VTALDPVLAAPAVADDLNDVARFVRKAEMFAPLFFDEGFTLTVETRHEWLSAVELMEAHGGVDHGVSADREWAVASTYFGGLTVSVQAPLAEVGE
jgi:hypothetical protein